MNSTLIYLINYKLTCIYIAVMNVGTFKIKKSSFNKNLIIFDNQFIEKLNSLN